MHILTANEQVAVRRSGGNYRKWVQGIVHDRWPKHGRIVWSAKPGGKIVRARISQGNWIAQCPHCPGSQVVEPGEPFFCVDCLMLGNEGYAQKVWFPRKHKKTIEAILMLRPNPLNRNWLVGETVEQLRKENITHGLPTDLDDAPPLVIGMPPKPRKPSPTPLRAHAPISRQEA